jgi:hypothetical protein
VPLDVSAWPQRWLTRLRAKPCFLWHGVGVPVPMETMAGRPPFPMLRCQIRPATHDGQERADGKSGRPAR